MADRTKKQNQAAAVGVGGAGVLGGTASLQRLEGVVQNHRKSRYDRKISGLQAKMPTKGTPVGDRQHVNGQYVPRGADYKAKRKAKVKGLQGEINDLRAKKNAVRKPRLAGNAKATWAGIAVGAPSVWYGARNQVNKANTRRRDVDAGIVGGALGAGAYQESSYALKPLDRRAERKIAEDPDLNRKQKAYQTRMRPKGAKAGDKAWRPYFRNYPKDLPGSRLKRTLAVTHTGRTGGAFTVAAGGAGAIGAAKLSQKQRVRKNMSESAFGVDHGDTFSKAMPGQKQQRQASPSRLMTGTVMGPYHGLVAGHGAGGKAKAAGTQFGLGTGGAVAGGTAGSLATTALTRGKAPAASSIGAGIGAGTGLLAGNRKGTKIAHNKGWLKPESR